MNKMFALAIALLLSKPVFAQSEASVAMSVAGLSEATGQSIGAAVGAGVGLTIGAVTVVGSAAYLTVASAADGASEAVQFTFRVPSDIAEMLRRRAGSQLETKVDASGTAIYSGEDLIVYLPNVAATSSSKRESL